MIVIPSHDRLDVLEQCLSSVFASNRNGHEVFVYDTNSKNSDYLRGIEGVIKKFPGTIFERSDEDCYEAGAQFYAYKNFASNTYFFIQDSVVITNNDFFVIVDEMLGEYDFVNFFEFKFNYYPREKEWAEEGIPIVKLPKKGVFGSMFAVRKDVLDKIPREWLIKTPKNKTQSCAMERRWSIMFDYVGAKGVCLNPFGENESFSEGLFRRYDKYLRKTWIHRD